MKNLIVFLTAYLFCFSSIYAQNITITSPNGGELYRNGTTQTITWTNTGSISNINIEFFNGSTWENIPGAQNIVNINIFNWTVPNTTTPKARIRISDASNPATNDISDSDFRIIFPNITSNNVVIMPLGDSITWGVNDPSSPDEDNISYRFTLWDSFRHNNYNFNFVGTSISGGNIFPNPENESHWIYRVSDCFKHL